MDPTRVVEEFPTEVTTMNNFDEVEKAAAAHEAREAAGRPQRRSSRTDEVSAALKLYLTTEQHRERTESSRAARDSEPGQEPDES